MLNNENYHSTEQRKVYMGYSQFKNFLKCEKEALAKVNGEVEEKSTTALLFGSYVDAYYSNELEDFKQKHPELYNVRTGELKSDLKGAETVIEAINNDEVMLKYLSGEHQVIMTGEIAGVPFKIKMDSYHPNKIIVDQKVMKDLDDIWVEKDGRNVKVNFIEAYRYDLEGAIYQEIERQNHLKETGEDRKLPFVLVVATKEDVPDKILIEIDQEFLDKALEEVIEKAPRFAAIKRGEIEPNGCGKCGTCRKTKKCTGVFSYKKLFFPEEEIIY